MNENVAVPVKKDNVGSILMEVRDVLHITNDIIENTKGNIQGRVPCESADKASEPTCLLDLVKEIRREAFILRDSVKDVADLI